MAIEPELEPKIDPKIATLLGFARKSKSLALGELAVEQSIKKGQAKLVILAEDVSAKKKTIIEKWCHDKDIYYLALSDKETYARVFNTRPQGFISVSDIQIAKSIWNRNSAGGD